MTQDSSVRSGGDLFDPPSSAIISDCGQYRYRLERQCIGSGQTTIIMVNPSTADATENDATIRKLLGFGNRYEWGRLVVGNLFAFRSVEVRTMAIAPDPIGPDNDGHLLAMLCEADRVVVAWGPMGKLPKRLRERYRRIREMASMVSRPLMSIGAPAKDGHPCHPLMLPYVRELQPWADPAALYKGNTNVQG